MPERSSPNGIVVVDKKPGMTSHDVVNQLRRIYGTKRVGHTGTLDPLATGVLVICLGHATRIVEYITASKKTYIGGAVFGITTDSQDITGTEIKRTDASFLLEQTVQEALPHFRGDILQTPPMVSAIHHEGKRLYELARKGIEVEREARPITIYHLEMTDFQSGEHPQATLLIECSTGTYIRTLIADIGEKLAVGGMMESLQRTQVGQFSLSEAYSLEDLQNRKEAGTLQETLRSIPEALAEWTQIVLTPDETRDIRMGRSVGVQNFNHGERGEKLTTENTEGTEKSDGERERGGEGENTQSILTPNTQLNTFLLLDEAGREVALANLREGRLQPMKVFPVDI